jgi:hypothetical protein
VLAARAVAHAEALRQAAREEKLAKAQEKRLSFNQKVGRLGKAFVCSQ